MSDAPQLAHTSNQPGAIRIYAVVLTVGVACALAIVSVYEVTRPIIQNNRVQLRRQAILDVLPDATQTVAFRWDQVAQEFDRAPADSNSAELVFAGFDDDGQLVGLAIEAQGMGYQDVVRMLYGYSFAEQAVIGIRVLESRETPGLGDRIESDADFLRNFDNLDVALNPQGTAVANRIVFVKPAEKLAAWQIDGITGATISSRAVAEMLSESTSDWIPRLHRRQNEFSLDQPEES
jgi:electron transport complex protein RnfG